MESVILSTPILTVLFALSLFLAVIGLKNKAGWFLPTASTVICLAASGYALLKGASLFEVATALLLFLAVNLLILKLRGEK